MKFGNTIWTSFCFKLAILNSHNPAKVHPFTQKIRKVTLQHAPENPKKVGKSVCKSQNVCPYKMSDIFFLQSRESKCGMSDITDISFT